MEKPPFDPQAARRLVEDLAAQVQRLPAGGTRFELEKELARMQVLLEDSEAAHPALESGLRSLHDLVDRAKAELQRDGVEAGLVLQAIGRILGLN